MFELAAWLAFQITNSPCKFICRQIGWVWISGRSIIYNRDLGLTGISRLWTWTLDPETADFGLDFSQEHTAKIALISKNGLVFFQNREKAQDWFCNNLPLHSCEISLGMA